MSETKKYPYTVEPNIIKLAPNYYRILIKKGSGKNQQVFSEYVSGKIGDARAVKRKGFAELENQKTKEKDKGKITLFEFSKEWLQFCRDTGLSPTTINGYKTIYAFRGTLGLLIQIPFFIAAYNFIHSISGLNGQSFLFIKDLSQPDALIHIGNISINLLPFVMTLFSLLAGFVYA